MEWYIGQPIIAIRDSTCGKIKKNQEFVIQGMIKSSGLTNCNCNTLLFDIGLKIEKPQSSKCHMCGSKGQPDRVHYKVSSLFAPFDINISEAEEAINKKEEISKYGFSKN